MTGWSRKMPSARLYVGPFDEHDVARPAEHRDEVVEGLRVAAAHQRLIEPGRRAFERREARGEASPQGGRAVVAAVGQGHRAAVDERVAAGFDQARGRKERRVGLAEAELDHPGPRHALERRYSTLSSSAPMRASPSATYSLGQAEADPQVAVEAEQVARRYKGALLLQQPHDQLGRVDLLGVPHEADGGRVGRQHFDVVARRQPSPPRRRSRAARSPACAPGSAAAPPARGPRPPGCCPGGSRRS